MIYALLIVLALIPASNIALNLFVLRAPPCPRGRPSVAILIPARDEAERIGACLDAALASEGVDFEVIVLDDHSSDATAEIVGEVSKVYQAMKRAIEGGVGIDLLAAARAFDGLPMWQRVKIHEAAITRAVQEARLDA